MDGAARNSCSGLGVLLETLLNYLTNNCSGILASAKDITILDDAQQPHIVYDFLMNAIWIPIVDYVFRRIPYMFVGVAGGCEG